ncbi:hypothetical protein AB0B56_08175 [Streptosporangium canum]|uniref:hypothetical protein n=1 Tax=Streptosporangium canum TaxID=324952 RepID=UPI00343778B1
MSALTGAGVLARRIVRRDRLILPVWGLPAAANSSAPAWSAGTRRWPRCWAWCSPPTC